MPEEIDADGALPADESGSLDTMPVVDVDERGHEVLLTLELPSGVTFTDSFDVPPVWGSNCDLKTILDAHGLGPGEVASLVGRPLPTESEPGQRGMEFSVDVDALEG